MWIPAMSPRLTELLHEYWHLVGEFEQSFGQAGQRAAARIRSIEQEIGRVAGAEHRCASCLSVLQDEAQASICRDCLAEGTD